MPRKTKSVKLSWTPAPEVKEAIEEILTIIDLPHIDASKISCYKTEGSTSRSYARIWAFPKIFQQALNIPPHYVVEVLSKYYDKLDKDEQTKVLIHELLHIPKNFSGALLSHKINGRHLDSLAKELFQEYQKKVSAQI